MKTPWVEELGLSKGLPGGVLIRISRGFYMGFLYGYPGVFYKDIQGFSIRISMDPIRGFYMDNQGFLMGIIMGILWEILFMNNEGFSEHFLWVCSSSISPLCLGCSVF